MLFNRFPLRRKPPPPPPPSPAMQLNKLLHDAIERIPYYRQIRLFWHDLMTERAFWPILLPLLAWVGWRTYQKERVRLLAIGTSFKAAQKQEEQLPTY